jgi:hypothetical protein
MSKRDMLRSERETMFDRKMRNAKWEEPKSNSVVFYFSVAAFVLVLFLAGLLGGLGEPLV